MKKIDFLDLLDSKLKANVQFSIDYLNVYMCEGCGNPSWVKITGPSNVKGLQSISITIVESLSNVCNECAIKSKLK